MQPSKFSSLVPGRSFIKDECWRENHCFLFTNPQRFPMYNCKNCIYISYILVFLVLLQCISRYIQIWKHSFLHLRLWANELWRAEQQQKWQLFCKLVCGRMNNRRNQKPVWLSLIKSTTVDREMSKNTSLILVSEKSRAVEEEEGFVVCFVPRQSVQPSPRHIVGQSQVSKKKDPRGEDLRWHHFLLKARNIYIIQGDPKKCHIRIFSSNLFRIIKYLKTPKTHAHEEARIDRPCFLKVSHVSR